MSQKTKKIETEILLLMILVTDTVNGFLTEILRIKYKEQENLKWIGFAIPLGIYFVVGIAAVVYPYTHISAKWLHYIRGSDTCECLPLDECECIRNCPHGSDWINITIKLCTIFGGVLYFFGDNFHKVYDKEKHVTHVSILVCALLIYRIAPILLKKLQRHCKDEPNKDKDQRFNWCSPNDNETHSLIVAYTYLLTIVVDFDVVLTLVLKAADNNKTDSLCNRKSDVKILWALYALMIIAFLIIELIIITIFIYNIIIKIRHYPYTKKNLCQLTLPSHIKKRWIMWDIFLSLSMPAAVVCFLLVDNQHPLDCYEIFTLKYEDEGWLRVSFLLFSYIVFSVVTIGFLSRKYFSQYIQI